jgi:hypothetical protein
MKVEMRAETLSSSDFNKNWNVLADIYNLEAFALLGRYAAQVAGWLQTFQDTYTSDLPSSSSWNV